MDKRILSLMMLSLLMLAAYVPMVKAHGAPFPIAYDPKHMIVDSIGPPETTDPAWEYDTASGELIMNVYDQLVAFDIDYTKGPYAAGLTDQFAPKLATTWSYNAIDEYEPVTGLTYKRRFDFAIRLTNQTGQPIKFHNGDTLTVADVEYSFERAMVQDRAGGPTWMFYQPLLDRYNAAHPLVDGNFGKKIDYAVRTSGNTVSFYFASTFADKAFLQILCQGWASIVDKAWCIANGDLDISAVSDGWANWADIYTTWHSPAESKIEGLMMGTGSFEFVELSATFWKIKRYVDFWDGWPARVRWNSNERLPGYVDKVTQNQVPEWTNRRDTFLGGLSDLTVVPRNYRDQVLGQSIYGEKVRSFYPFDTLACTSFFFTMNISTISPYMGVSGGLAPNTFSQAGIPRNIFGKHTTTGVDEGLKVRKGIAYLYDYVNWLQAAFVGEGTQPASYIVKGLSYFNQASMKYAYDLTKAQEYLQAAWGTSLWNNGMKFTIVYNVGNVGRQTAAEMIRDKLNAMNTKFHVDVQGANWGTVMLPQLVSRQLPIFLIGWLADYPDPHNFAFPFAHSLGTFAQYQGYKNTVVDALIDAGVKMADGPAYPAQKWLDIPDPRVPFTNATGTYGFNNWPSTLYTAAADWIAHPPDTRWPRLSVYYALQALAIDDAASVALVQASGRHFEPSWVRGWYYNPIDPGYYYNRMWKAVTHYGDVNNDQAVNSLDAASISAHWYSPPSVGPQGYAPQADLTGGQGGTSGTLWGYVKAISDGKINIVDVGLLNAYWDDPKGPSSP